MFVSSCVPDWPCAHKCAHTSFMFEHGLLAHLDRVHVNNVFRLHFQDRYIDLKLN